MELLLPAGSPEAVTAAVQSGADAIYLSLDELSGCRKTVNFSDNAFEAAVRYCRVRGCRVYFALNIPTFEEEMQKAAGFALRAQRAGVDAVIVRDLGVFSVLRRLLPEMPLFADHHLNFTTPESAALAKSLGFQRIFLPPEMPLEEIRRMASCDIETAVFVQTGLCAAVTGTCRMSALANRESADRGLCSELCREKYTMGGRWDDNPLSFRDRTLIDKIPELQAAGVDCLCVGNRERRNEYVAAFAAAYRQTLRENRTPSPQEWAELERIFVPNGFAEKEMYEPAKVPEPVVRGTDKLCAALRKKYTEGEERRVSVNFAVVAEEADKPIRLGVRDEEGHRAVIDGPVPREEGDTVISKEGLADSMYRTAGTPFKCTGIGVVSKGEWKVSGVEMDMARRNVLYKLSEQRADVPQRTEGEFPSEPTTAPHPEMPGAIFAFQNADQLTPGMAELQPESIYLPMELLLEHPHCADAFRNNGTGIVCSLPAAICGEKEEKELETMLRKLRELDVDTVLCGSWPTALMAAREGFRLRGDEGLHATNAYALQSLASAGFVTATLSPEMTLAQIRDVPKPLPVEMIVYGRLSAMVTGKCLLCTSAGRCTCTTPGQMADTHGGVWPVTKHFGCRNTVWSSRKLWLGDVTQDWVESGLWAGRLNFTTESPRECLEVANSYLQNTGYRPNGMTRGLYYRGVL